MTDTSSDTVNPSVSSGLISKAEFVALVASMMALNALAIDIMVPALNDIGAAFRLTDANDQQLVIFAYVLGFGTPQLIWGPISDRFGRRAILLYCLIGYAICSLLCAHASGFTGFLIARFMMGVFSSACRVVAVSVVRDVYVGRGMAQIMSMVMTVFMIVPLLAPGMGQLILLIAPWPWIFFVLVTYSVLVAIWSVFRLPETLSPENRKALNFVTVFSAYKKVVTTRVACGYVLASGVLFGGLFAFIFSIEQIMREVFAQDHLLGLWFALVVVGIVISNVLNALLVKTYGMRFLSHIAAILFTCLGGLNCLLMWQLGPVFPVFMVGMVATFCTIGMMGPNFNAIAMEPLGDIAGTASAALGFASTTLAGFLGYLISSQYNGTVLPLLLGFTALGASAVIILLVTERGHLFERHA